MRIIAATAALLTLAACNLSADEGGTPAEPESSGSSSAAANSIVAATCNLGKGTFTIEERGEVTDFRFVGLDAPSSAGTVLYSATIGSTQFGTKVIGSETNVFLFNADGQTNLDPSVATIAPGEVSTAFATRDWVIAEGRQVRAVLNVDGVDVAQCKASV